MARIFPSFSTAVFISNTAILSLKIIYEGVNMFTSLLGNKEKNEKINVQNFNLIYPGLSSCAGFNNLREKQQVFFQKVLHAWNIGKESRIVNVLVLSKAAMQIYRVGSVVQLSLQAEIC